MFTESFSRVAQYAGLTFLSILLVGIRIRHGSILRPIRERLSYRLLLAAVAGWLAALFLHPFGTWGPFPEYFRDFFIPGTIFGVLVIVAMLDDPVRHLLRVAILVWAATIAHAAIWFTGLSVMDVWDTYELPEPASGMILSMILSGLSGSLSS